MSEWLKKRTSICDFCEESFTEKISFRCFIAREKHREQSWDRHKLNENALKDFVSTKIYLSLCPACRKEYDKLEKKDE